MAVYARKMFGMFGGEEETVKIECDNALAGVMIDRFGKDITFIKKDNGHFTVNVKVAVSRQFLAWVMALGEEAKIIWAGIGDCPDECGNRQAGKAISIKA